MSVTFSVSTTSADRAVADLLVVPAFVGVDLGPGADALDHALSGGLAAFIKNAGFSGKAGEALAVPAGGVLKAKAALLVGLGEQSKLTVDSFRTAGAVIGRRGSKLKTVATTLLDAAPATLDAAAVAQALAEGVVLGGYKFLDYKSDASQPTLSAVKVLGTGGAAIRAALGRGATVASAVTWARDIVNTPAAEKSPMVFAQAARELLRGTGVKVEILDVPAMEKLGLGGVLGVGRGSDRPPRFVRMTYAPARARGSLALVGKGVVFDSGGLSIKTASGMETMKTDMSGAAAVIATMSVLRTLGVKAKVVGYAPMVENMPSGNAIRPGDVVKFRNGKTAEVLNTDAEGRLILADALALAAEAKPDAIVDLATLTGACMVALGDKIAGLLANDEAWGAEVRSAADRAGEPVWPLPLPVQYRTLIDSEIADMKNIGSNGYGGALTAGLFLQEFVAGRPWVHLDIAGPARANADDGSLVRGATGFGVRTLIELVTEYQPPPKV